MPSFWVNTSEGAMRLARGSLADRFDDETINVLDVGASGSAQTAVGSIVSGSNQLTVASPTDFEVGHGISVANAGPASALLVAKITAINGPVFTLDTNAGTTASNKAVKHEDTAAFQAAVDALPAAGGTVKAPAGYYRIGKGLAAGSAITLRNHIRILGERGGGTSQPATVGTVLDASSMTGGKAINAGSSYGVALQQFVLQGATAGTTAYGIWDGSGTNFFYEDVVVEGFRYGISLISLTQSYFRNLKTNDALYVGIDVYDTSTTILENCTAANGQLGALGNLVIEGNSKYVDVHNAVTDEIGAGASILVLGADRIRIHGGVVFYGPFGIRLGDGNTNPTNVTLEDIRVEPFAAGVPTQTVEIRGSGHRLMNVTTNPNGGGDINDLATDTTYINVNGKWKYPTTDASGTPGNATINKASGKVAIAVGTAAVTVTNSLVTAASIVQATIQTADATLTFIKSVVPGAGTFTITGNANATAATTVAFTVQN